MERLVGHGNVTEVTVNGVETLAVVDTGSMLTTINADLYSQLGPKPAIRSLENFNLRVTEANGHKVPYLGYVKLGVRVLFIDHEVCVPVLVVPNTGNNGDASVIIGTNVIRYIRNCSMDVSVVPEEWSLAF